jgi:hypothetical protein
MGPNSIRSLSFRFIFPDFLDREWLDIDVTGCVVGLVLGMDFEELHLSVAEKFDEVIEWGRSGDGERVDRGSMGQKGSRASRRIVALCKGFARHDSHVNHHYGRSGGSIGVADYQRMSRRTQNSNTCASTLGSAETTISSIKTSSCCPEEGLHMR